MQHIPVLLRNGLTSKDIPVLKGNPTMRALFIILNLCLVIHLVGAGRSVHAQDSDDDARTLFEGARIHYDRGEFEEAAESFTSAFDISGRTQLLYNIYLAHRDAGNPGEAAVALRRYLEEMPAEELADQRELLEGRLESLESQAAAQTNESESPVVIEDPDDAQRSPAQPETSGPIGGVVLLAVGGAAVVAGVVTAIVTSGIEGDLEEACTNMICGPDQQENIDRGKTMALLTDILLIGGATLAVGGALWWILGRSEDSVTPSVACVSDGCRLSVQGSF